MAWSVMKINSILVLSSQRCSQHCMYMAYAGTLFIRWLVCKFDFSIFDFCLFDCLFVCVCSCLSSFLCVCVPVRLCAWVSVCVSFWFAVSVCLFLCASVRVCVIVCVHIYVCAWVWKLLCAALYLMHFCIEACSQNMPSIIGCLLVEKRSPNMIPSLETMDEGNP